MQWVSCASSRLTVWLQGLKVRDLSSTPVSRAILETSRSGIRLQIWRKTLNRQRVGLMLFLFFIPAVWQVQNVKPTLFAFSVGWLCLFITSFGSIEFDRRVERGALATQTSVRLWRLGAVEQVTCALPA